MADMLCITTPAYSDPSRYELATVPRPAVSRPDDVLIQVRAASVNPVDLKLASGVLKMAVKDEYVLCYCTVLIAHAKTHRRFPYKIGYDCSGVVAEVGDEVSSLKVGDEVFARLPEIDRGKELI